MNPRSMGRKGTLAQRMARRTQKTETCWLWIGDIKPSGYGRIGHKGVRRLAHRIAYEMANGPIPDNLVIDHLCRVRNCVNPEHLEAVPHRVNTERGVGYTAERGRATHCIRSHELSGENLYITPDGRRQCRSCVAERRRLRTERSAA